MAAPDVTKWSDPSKILLVSALTGPFVTAWYLRLFAVEADATLSPYVSRGFLPAMFVFMGAQTFGLWGVALVAFAQRLRGTHRTPWLVHVQVQLSFASTAFSLYVLGTFTSSMAVMMLVLPVVGLLLFEPGPIKAGMVTGVVGGVVGIVLPALGLAPYAPFVGRAPFAEGRLDPTWLVSQGVPTLVATTVGLFIYVSLLGRLKARQRELEVLSSTDALTGLANRRVFFTRLEDEVATGAREGYAVSVLMIDVDRFKSINDTHGHHAGDEVLRQLGARLKDLVRGRDVAARLGGEELGVLLPDTTLEGARLVAQRVLEAARAVKLPDGRAVTVSVGAAQWQQGERGDALMSRADQALYAAKSGGRDQESA